jgi:hypothetical protein
MVGTEAVAVPSLELSPYRGFSLWIKARAFLRLGGGLAQVLHEPKIQERSRQIRIDSR